MPTTDPSRASESAETPDDTMILEVVETDAPPLFRPPAPEKAEALGPASDAASVAPPPPAITPPAPVRVAELAPADTGVEAPRTRWAAVVWGLFFAAVSLWALWILAEPERREAAAEWAFTLDTATGVAVLILGLGVILLVAGAAGLLRRTQRRRES